MFKVFIYLYIFLESVLCKTWFWLFAHRGEVGAAVLLAGAGGGGGSWAQPRPGGPSFAAHGRTSPRAGDTSGPETALCRLSTLPILATPTPSLLLHANPRIDAKGVPGTRGGSWPAPKSWFSEGGCCHGLWRWAGQMQLQPCLLQLSLETARCCPGGRWGTGHQPCWDEKRPPASSNTCTRPPGPPLLSESNSRGP